MWPAMIAGPNSPGVGPPVYQPAGKPLGGTSSDPSARKPRSIRPESTPIAAIRTRTGVDSGLMDLGLRADGSLEVPPSGFPAGWYTGGPTPGELGPAIIAGHIDWNGPGVFFRLRDLKPGDH